MFSQYLDLVSIHCVCLYCFISNVPRHSDDYKLAAYHRYSKSGGHDYVFLFTRKIISLSETDANISIMQHFTYLKRHWNVTLAGRVIGVVFRHMITFSRLKEVWHCYP